jgi:hypothetical protein
METGLESRCSASWKPAAAFYLSGAFQPYARTYAYVEVYHYHREKGFLIKICNSSLRQH